MNQDVTLKITKQEYSSIINILNMDESRYGTKVSRLNHVTHMIDKETQEKIDSSYQYMSQLYIDLYQNGTLSVLTRHNATVEKLFTHEAPVVIKLTAKQYTDIFEFIEIKYSYAVTFVDALKDQREKVLKLCSEISDRMNDLLSYGINLDVNLTSEKDEPWIILYDYCRSVIKGYSRIKKLKPDYISN